MFMEEDMVDFLDTHLSTDNLKKQSVQAHHEDFAGLFNEDSYESKLFSALDKNDVATAKKILHEVKDEILKKPVGSVERKQLEATLHTLYKKFKHYIETVSLVNKFEEDLEAVEHPNATRQSQPPQTEPSQETTDSEDDSLDVYLLDLQHAIAVNDLSEAKTAYERAKDEFARLSTNQKKKYHKKLLSAHKSIQDLLSKNSQEKSEAEQTKPEQTRLEEPNQDSQDSATSYNAVSNNSDSHFTENPSDQKQTTEQSKHALDEQLTKIQDAIHNQDFAFAKRLYEEAKDAFARLSTNQKKQYHKRLLSLRDEIAESLPKQSPMARVEENLQQAMHEGDLHEAMLHYEELRSLIRELPENERSQHTQRAKKYYSWIMTAWNSWQSGHPVLDQKEKRLSGQP